MAKWTRVSLEDLHYAIAQELKTGGDLGQKEVGLIAVKNKIAMELQESERVLDECRAAMCGICRANRMYPCDVSDGWTPNCALLKRHAV
jgi:hypothetical protein